ncbi:MAG: ComF family protein [Lachnospiraceae bacterium]|nr:ComF family protein [Lachnospiraceae bacterium]
MLDLIFPPRCPVCDGLLKKREQIVCSRCEKNLPYVMEPYCMKCGKALEDEGDDLCPDCRRITHDFVRCRSVFVYEDRMKSAMYRFKYGGRKEYAKAFADLTVRHLGDWIRQIGPDAVISVPLHKSRMRKRGYNQAGLFAKALSERLGLVCREDLVIRSKKTLPQKNLSRSERQKNLKKAFKIRQNDVKLGTVLLIDDIYTTGSTMDALAQTFSEAGAKSVYCVTICTGKA